jgi:hypothetical protein
MEGLTKPKDLRIFNALRSSKGFKNKYDVKALAILRGQILLHSDIWHCRHIFLRIFDNSKK